jgi:hypothetical protein
LIRPDFIATARREVKIKCVVIPKRSMNMRTIIRQRAIRMMVTITSMGRRSTPMNIAMMTAIMTMNISAAIKGKPHF